MEKQRIATLLAARGNVRRFSTYNCKSILNEDFKHVLCLFVCKHIDKQRACTIVASLFTHKYVEADLVAFIGFLFVCCAENIKGHFTFI